MEQTHQGHAATLATAVLIVGLAAAGGGYGLGTRAGVAIGAWAAVAALIGFGLAAPRVPRLALLSIAGLGALTLLAGLSALWADSAELAVIELGRDAMYAGLLIVVVLVGRRSAPARWSDGLAIGIAAVAVLALLQRCVPELMPADRLPAFLPGVRTRLSYPVGYWNGLAILVALGLPPLLRAALEARGAATRGVALAAVPPIGGVIYLTSSRGGVAVAVVALVAFLVFVGRRVAAVAALSIGGAGTALGIAVLHSRRQLTDGPLGSHRALSQGHSAAVLIAIVALVTGAAWALLSRSHPLTIKLRRPVTIALLAGLVAVLAVGIALADPAKRLHDFKQPPTAPGQTHGSYVASHLLSGTGSGRWQFWGSAWDQFSAHPVAGDGAGSFEAWWAAHAPIAYYIRDAHSLYLQTMGELGVLGLIALLVAFVPGLISIRRAMRLRDDPHRAAIAALGATFVAFLAGAALDWIWQLAAVGSIGIVSLGVLVGGGPRAQADRAPEPARGDRRWSSALGRALVVAVAAALLVMLALPWLTDREVQASQRAARAGDVADAESHALDAQSLEPWASSPRLQLALVYESVGSTQPARAAIGAAIARDRDDWRLWLVATRLALDAGDGRAARASLTRARALDPRSPYWH